MADAGRSKNGQLLFEAARSGQLDLVKTCLWEDKVKPDEYRNYSNHTALHIACMFGKLSVVCELIQAKSDINARSVDGDTPLILAAVKGHTEVVRVLLESSADPNIQNDEHSTALILATAYGHEATISLLLEYGADPTLSDKDPETLVKGKTARDYANERGFPSLVKVLDDAVVLWESQLGKSNKADVVFEAKEKADVRLQSKL
eukprot:c6778_g1_i1.p1 GENE.c6778_g1_i1~~c6778_g1_i1.p1  ORF type:complete len:204 (-),score=42.78 c6778_g1_i1:124-735(-)